jgi:hypothetical protein
VHRDIYCTSRNKANAMIRDAKTIYYNQKVNDCGSDQKALFKIVKQLLGQQSKLILPLHDDIDEILEKFNTFFVPRYKLFNRSGS